MTAEPQDIEEIDVPEVDEKKQLSAVVNAVSDSLEDDDLSSASQQVACLEIEDQAEVINRLSDTKREQLVKSMNVVLDHEVIAQLDHDAADDVLTALGSEKSAEVISEMDTEDAVQVIAELDEEDQQEILDNLDDETRHLMEEGLSYPEESAGRLMRKKMVALPEFWTVGDAIDYMRTNEGLPEDFYVMFVVDPQYHLVGEVVLSKVMRYARHVKISNIMNAKIHPQGTHVDQEEVAYDFRKYALVEAPVVNDDGRLMGTITVDDVVDVMQDEIEEDFLRAGGVSEQDIQDSIWGAVKKRFPWLFINLLTAIAASVIIDVYQETIEQLVLLAVLMPIVASMGGNAGIQASTVAVRAIATRRIPVGHASHVLMKEMALGAINGVGIALVTGVAIYMLYHDPAIALVFAAATIVTMMIAGLSGAGLPMLLMRLGVDPAISSGVFLTMLTDMVGFFAFLGLAAFVLT